jgi:hypothetical protein
VGEHAPSAPAPSRPLCVGPPERMHRARLSPYGERGGLLGEVQHARLLQEVCEECEQGRIGPQDLAHQHKTQYGGIRLITMGTGRGPLSSAAASVPLRHHSAYGYSLSGGFPPTKRQQTFTRARQ